LSFASHSSISEGSLDEEGNRRSIFRSDILMSRLLARQAEEAGTPVEGVRGMPLGFPALTAEEIQLLESWIAQGRPN
jgi:hypothetical protein